MPWPVFAGPHQKKDPFEISGILNINILATVAESLEDVDIFVDAHTRLQIEGMKQVQVANHFFIDELI